MDPVKEYLDSKEFDNDLLEKALLGYTVRLIRAGLIADPFKDKAKFSLVEPPIEPPVSIDD